MNTNWNTKEEYLAFVQDWKRVYKALSAYIRGSRVDGRICQSLAAGGKRHERVTDEQLSARAAERATVMKLLTEELGTFWYPSFKAKELLEIRKAEKERAGLARAEALAATPKAA